LFTSPSLLVPIITQYHTRCHNGNSIVYDTVSNLSWAVDVRTHGIVTVIEKVLTDPWPPSEEEGRQVPEAKPETDCVVSLYFSSQLQFSTPCRNAIVGSMEITSSVGDLVVLLVVAIAREGM
jgi:hypothetical protein